MTNVHTNLVRKFWNFDVGSTAGIVVDFVGDNVIDAQKRMRHVLRIGR